LKQTENFHCTQSCGLWLHPQIKHFVYRTACTKKSDAPSQLRSSYTVCNLRVLVFIHWAQLTLGTAMASAL